MVFKDTDGWVLFWIKNISLAVIAIAFALLVDSCMGIIDQKTDVNLALMTNLLLLLVVFAYLFLVLEPARKWAEKHQRKK